MDKIRKILAKFTSKEREIIKDTLNLILLGRLSNLDIKKLKGKADIFRVRIGQIRIIYRNDGESFKLIAIERRSDNTYKNL